MCVNALVHGNEVCGAITADALLCELTTSLTPARGKLSLRSPTSTLTTRLMPRSPSNRAAWRKTSTACGTLPRYGPRDSRELRCARALRPF